MRKRIFLNESMRSLVVCLMMGCGTLAWAHSPILLIEDNHNGTMTVTGGFSTGQMGAGRSIQLRDRDSEKVLWQGTLNGQGELVCPKQATPYTVFFDGGPGHTLQKPGLVLAQGETVPAALPASDAVTGATPKQAVAAEHEEPPIHYPDWVLPLSLDFDESILAVLPEMHLGLQNDLGLVRQTSLMQCYQRHGQSGMAAILALVERKRAAGREVDFTVNPVGLCFGVTTGYLALDFALETLYEGEVVAGLDEFTITTSLGMGGLWDTWELCLGRHLEDQTIPADPTVKGPIFEAQSRARGSKIVFTYSPGMRQLAGRLGAIKRCPGDFAEGELARVKQEVVRTLLQRRAQGDYGYFQVLERWDRQAVR